MDDIFARTCRHPYWRENILPEGTVCRFCPDCGAQWHAPRPLSQLLARPAADEPLAE